MLSKRERLIVSFSGGLDSSLLSRAAHDALGERALCVILDTETMPRSELKYAQDLAMSQGWNCTVARYSMLDREEFCENPETRCYVCKKEAARVLKGVAEARGFEFIADGVNLTDCEDFRPGIQASSEEGIWHPFVEAGITKDEIRAQARKLELPFWDKPSSACLSSRIPYGHRITRSNLKAVEEAEDFLKSCGFGQLRVRVHGRTARIELLAGDMEKALSNRVEICRRLKDMGFDYITLDLEGFRSGSMNEVLWTSRE